MKVKKSPLHKKIHPNSLWLFIFLAALTVGSITYAVNLVQKATPTTITQAEKPNFLTPGDDIFSLEQDLERLKTDPAASEIEELFK